MSPFDPRNPASRVERPAGPVDACGFPAPVLVQQFTTSNGVQVTVYDPPEKRRRKPPEPPPPPVIVFPPNQPVKDRAGFMESLFRRQGEYILRTLLARRDVKPESAKDLRIRVIEVVCDYAVKKHPPTNEQAFIKGVIQHVAANNGREGRNRADPDADVEDAITSAPDPEQVAQMAEWRAKLPIYLGRLPPKLAQVIRCIDLMEMTYEEAALALGRPVGTVSTLHTSAVRELRRIAQDSERAAAQRLPGR